MLKRLSLLKFSAKFTLYLPTSAGTSNVIVSNVSPALNCLSPPAAINNLPSLIVIPSSEIPTGDVVLLIVSFVSYSSITPRLFTVYSVPGRTFTSTSTVSASPSVTTSSSISIW